MLEKLRFRGFKSLAELEVQFPRLTVLFGPNAAGKSNILEAVEMLSRIATSRTVAEAFAGTVRGYPLEAFAFPKDGLPGLLRQPTAQLELNACLKSQTERYNYRIAVEIQPASGVLAVRDEYLARLNRNTDAAHGNPVVEQIADKLLVRKKGKGSHPREEVAGLNHAILSDLRFSGDGYDAFDQCRKEFEAWRVYYLDPRVAMRSARPPADVRDIGVLGADIAPYLYRLRKEHPKHYNSISRTLRSIIPSIESVSVDLDEKRGTLDIQVRQDGSDYSSRIVSEGTLRVLALCAIAANPWAGGLVAFEEPENGVHPRRLELIAKLLISLAVDQGRQVIVTTHSALFCDAILRLTSAHRSDISLLSVVRKPGGTAVAPFDCPQSFWTEIALEEDLSSPAEDGTFEGMLLRGLADG
jgi:predicted ATPase